jgi:hypothetical protein
VASVGSDRIDPETEGDATMNKRSAMMVAAGLVLAMLVAGMAVAAGLTGPEASAGGSRANGEVQERAPKVRTITETVTIHRTAKGDDATPEPVIVTQPPATPTAAATGVDDDEHEDGYEHEDGDEHEDGYEHEDGDDDGWDDEGGDHEDEDD